MARLASPSTLIAFGVVMGALLGTLIIAPLLPPEGDKPWLETYGGALGALMTGVAALVVVVQIATSERHQRRVLEEQFRRDHASWRRTDEMVERQVQIYESRLTELRKQFFERNPSLKGPEFPSWSDLLLGRIKPSYTLPIAGSSKIRVSDRAQVICTGASPGVAAAFMDFTDVLRELNDCVSEAIRDTDVITDGDPHFEIPVIQAIQYTRLLYRLEELRDVVFAMAAETEPRLFEEGSPGHRAPISSD